MSFVVNTPYLRLFFFAHPIGDMRKKERQIPILRNSLRSGCTTEIEEANKIFTNISLAAVSHFCIYIYVDNL